MNAFPLDSQALFRYYSVLNARVAELADALDLGCDLAFFVTAYFPSYYVIT
jgi:hypothetical protein